MKVKLRVDYMHRRNIHYNAELISWRKYRGILFDVRPSARDPFYLVQIKFKNRWQDFCREFVKFVHDEEK